MRFSSFGGCERVNQSRMLKWGSTHSAHSLLLHSFTSIKRRKGRNCSQIPRYFVCVILQFSPHFLELEFPSVAQIPSVFLLTDPGTMWMLINFAKQTNFSILSLFAILAGINFEVPTKMALIGRFWCHMRKRRIQYQFKTIPFLDWAD